MSTSHYDTLLITHRGALRRKYGVAGAEAVRDSLDQLVASASQRGLRSKVISLDNTTSMRAARTGPVPDGDWAATLIGVDRLASRYSPAYIVLVGATDVVPQARVSNPFVGLGSDPDPYVPSDLPFACDLPDTWTTPASDLIEASDLLAVTRVVGRVPDLVGADDPAMLLAALGTVRSYTARSPSTYQKVFSLSAAAWRASSTATVGLLPGPAPTTHLSPPARSGWTKAALAAPTHFVNCHGGDFLPDWLGQQTGGPVETVALTPEDVDGRITAGTIVAAECCYGAMHQAPSELNGRVPLMWAYLRSGAYAAIGSSTTSYGPASGNGQADLVCRYVLEGILGGASTGRALLDARQRFIRETGALSPADLKTLAQFDLLGDPSVVPVVVPHAIPKTASAAQLPDVPSPTLAQRRGVLAAVGRSLGASVPRAGRRSRRPGPDAPTLASEAGVRPNQISGQVTSFGENRRAPRAGFSYHVLPIRAAGRDGFVVAREIDGVRDTTTIFRK